MNIFISISMSFYLTYNCTVLNNWKNKLENSAIIDIIINKYEIFNESNWISLNNYIY